MGDFRLEWSDGAADLVFDGEDLSEESGLETSALLSLFTDARARDGDALPDDSGDRRGWWGDGFSEVDGDEHGSRLWLLERAKSKADAGPRARRYALDALDWQVDGGLADRIAAEAAVDRFLMDLDLEIDAVEGRPVFEADAGDASAADPVFSATPTPITFTGHGGVLGGSSQFASSDSFTPDPYQEIFFFTYSWKSGSVGDTPTISGHGATWTQVANVVLNTEHRMCLFRGTAGASPSADTVDADFGLVQNAAGAACIAGLKVGADGDTDSAYSASTGAISTTVAQSDANAAHIVCVISEGNAPYSYPGLTQLVLEVSAGADRISAYYAINQATADVYCSQQPNYSLSAEIKRA